MERALLGTRWEQPAPERKPFCDSETTATCHRVTESSARRVSCRRAAVGEARSVRAVRSRTAPRVVEGLGSRRRRVRLPHERDDRLRAGRAPAGRAARPGAQRPQRPPLGAARGDWPGAPLSLGRPFPAPPRLHPVRLFPAPLGAAADRPRAGMGPRGAGRAAGCLLLCCALAASRVAPRRRRPSFGGQVAENRPAGTRVHGLSIPLTRLGHQTWCADVRGRRWRLQLLGEGHAHFQAALHARSGRVWLRTRRPLDREARPLYALRLGLCCRRCAPRGAAPAELAALTVRVLDDNDNAPRFVGGPPRGVTRLRVEETLALRSAVWHARAEDADAGPNAELRYFARPSSEHFFVVPRSGRVVLVRSLLHLRAPIPLRLYARDRGRPPRLSAPLELEVLPQPRRLPPPRARRRRRAPPPPPPVAPLALAVPEDARPGTLLAALPPAPFAAAWFELVSPPAERSPLRVERDDGAVTVAVPLDREAAAAWDILVRVRQRAGVCPGRGGWAPRWGFGLLVLPVVGTPQVPRGRDGKRLVLRLLKLRVINEQRGRLLGTLTRRP